MAKTALPIAGKAAGAFFGGPIGAKIGGSLGQGVSNLFEIELEGLSPEDQEFEIAKRIVRFGGEAAQNTAQLATQMPPAQAVKTALKQTAQTQAPGMLKPMRPSPVPPVRPGYGRGQRPHTSGRWYRQGTRIVLIGV